MPPRVVTLDRFTRTLLVALTALLAILVIELAARGPGVQFAAAQVPNSGAQRIQQLDEIKRTNELLKQILDRLTNGPLPVKNIDRAAAPEKGAGS